ncbi:MAG: tetratricopeptide repeat protein [Gammaproteobacteria bacterium]|jgi:tetratricopeptide (TPR) repeat protein
MPRFPLVVVAAGVLAGCAGMPAPAPAPVQAPAWPPASHQRVSLDTHLLLAEMALARDDPATGAREYLAASRLNTDQELARRATLLAFASHDTRLALEAAARWHELAPGELAVDRYEALLHLRNGDPDAALTSLRHLVNNATTSSDDMLRAIAGLLAQEDDTDAALAVMQRLAAAYPDKAGGWYGLGILALQSGRGHMAVTAADRAARLAPNELPVKILQARAAFVAGQHERGLARMKALADAHPTNDQILFALGAMLLQADRTDEAAERFQALLKLKPDDADGLFAMGMVRMDQKRLDDARQYFTRLLTTGQRADDAYYYLGAIAERQKRNPEALIWYRRIEHGDHLVPAQIAIARVLIQMDESEAARRYLDALRSENPDMAVAIAVGEGNLLMQHRQYQAALKVFSDTLADHPDDADLLYSRSLVHEQLGNIDAAVADLKHLLRVRPGDPQALNALGYTLTVHTDRYTEAAGYIRRALDQRPDDPAILDSMGWVLYRLGQPDRAVEYLNRAWAQLKDPEVAAHLSEVLWALGRHDAARKLLAEAMDAHPDDQALKDVFQRLME